MTGPVFAFLDQNICSLFPHNEVHSFRQQNASSAHIIKLTFDWIKAKNTGHSDSDKVRQTKQQIESCLFSQHHVNRMHWKERHRYSLGCLYVFVSVRSEKLIELNQIRLLEEILLHQRTQWEKNLLCSPVFYSWLWKCSLSNLLGFTAEAWCLVLKYPLIMFRGETISEAQVRFSNCPLNCQLKNDNIDLVYLPLIFHDGVRIWFSMGRIFKRQ